MLNNVRRRGRACAYCNGKRVDHAEAVAAMRAAGLEPTAPFPGSDTPWTCTCTACGQESSPNYTNIKRGQGGCRFCGRVKAGQSRRYDEAQAVATMQANGFEPLEPYPGANEAWRCRCLTCNKQSNPRMSNVTCTGHGCPWCSGRNIEPGRPEAFMLSVGLDPLEPYPGRHAPWRCRCQRCQREVSPSYGNVRQGKRCRWCAESGFNAAEAAIVYLLSHPVHNAAKVGIANTFGDRLSQHRLQGWQTVAIERVSGEIAIAIEKNILRWWRTDLGLPAYLGPLEMPHRGWTETVDLDAIDIAATINRIRTLAAVGVATLSA